MLRLLLIVISAIILAFRAINLGFAVVIPGNCEQRIKVVWRFPTMTVVAAFWVAVVKIASRASLFVTDSTFGLCLRCFFSVVFVG